MATSSEGAVRASLKAQADIQPPASLLHGLYEQYCQDQSNRLGLKRDFTFSQKRSVLSYITEQRDVILAHSSLPPITLTLTLESGMAQYYCRGPPPMGIRRWCSSCLTGAPILRPIARKATGCCCELLPKIARLLCSCCLTRAPISILATEMIRHRCCKLLQAGTRL